MPASGKDPEGWSATDKFTVVLEAAGARLPPRSALRPIAPEAVVANEKAVLSQRVDAVRRALRAVRTEGAGEAPRPGPEGNQTAQTGAAPQGESAGGGGSTADCGKEDPGFLGRGRGRSHR